MSEPSPEQSFTIHLKSLTDFADEFTTQIQSLQAPMDHLATMSGTPPQYGAFHEAWTLGAGEQAAIEEMYTLLGQVKQAIAFAGDVTGTVADGYRNADDSIAYALGGSPGSVYGGGSSGADPWSNGQDNIPDQQSGWGGDPNQNNGGAVYGAPVSDPSDSGPWVPNQDAGSFVGNTVSAVTAVPLVGALLGGALLGGVAKSKSNKQPPNTSVSVTVDSSAAGSGALPLWTPPPDPGSVTAMPTTAPTPQFPGQDSSWNATFPGSGQGGS